MDINAFHLEQYKMLREEIVFSMGQLYSTETYAAIAVTAVYAWLLVNKHRVSARAVWFIPPLLIIASAIHCLILSLRISTIGGYLMRIEEAAIGQDATLPGWERYKLTRHWIDTGDFVLATLAWVFAFGVSIGVSWWASRINSNDPRQDHPPQPQQP